MAIPAFLAIYIGLSLTKGVSIWFAVAYVTLSLICLLAYAFDKSAAIAGRWRSSEQSLLLLGLVGGWAWRFGCSAVVAAQVEQSFVPECLLGHRGRQCRRLRPLPCLLLVRAGCHMEVSSNPSINRTCPGKPGHAGYLKR